LSNRRNLFDVLKRRLSGRRSVEAPSDSRQLRLELLKQFAATLLAVFPDLGNQPVKITRRRSNRLGTQRACLPPVQRASYVLEYFFSRVLSSHP
jgi:hypothetical protein